MRASAQARHHMIDGQLEPNQVLSPRITAAMGVVPREPFVPEAYRESAYLDEMIPLGRDRYMLTPLLLGQMLELLQPAAAEKALVIGCGTGYSAALMHSMGCQVHMIEESGELAGRARQILHENGLGAIEVHSGALDMGYEAAAPYDIIVVEGGVEVCPEAWKTQLNPDGGRLAYIEITHRLPLSAKGRGAVQRLTRDQDQWVETIGPDVGAPILPGAEVKEGFRFD